MNNVKVWIDYTSFGKVMKSNELKEACYQAAKEIADRAGSGYRASSYYGKKRAGAYVWDNTGTMDNTLLKAVR